MADTNQETVRVNIRDINPLEHITSDLSKGFSNYNAILNGLITWNTTDNPNVTVRLSTDNYPYFVDYTFPSRAAFMAGGGTVAEDGLPKDTFDYNNMIDMVATTTDEATIRLTATDGNRGSWTMFEEAIIYDETEATASRPYKKGQFLRYPISGSDAKIICVANLDIAINSTLDLTNTRPVVTKWEIADYEKYDDYPGIVTYTVSNDTGPTTISHAYVLRGKSKARAPGYNDSNWQKIAESYTSKANGTFFDSGMLYIYSTLPDCSDAALYMYVGRPVAKTGSVDERPLDEHGELNENWYGPVILVPVTDITGSTVLHHVPTTDINGFIFRSNSHEVTSLSAMSNLAVHEGTSEPHKGLKVFSTSNYVMWPENESNIWLSDKKDYSDSVSYTAKMVFHHASEDVKMCNIINYDGPDLDKGLAIYLPVNDRITGDNGEAAYMEAQDGATFEFMFRIWPNASYNGASSPDLIINKAHIYVYSVQRSDELENGRVLAKFSMARLTNFYLWAENVAVPNRPVFYKAKFIYSKEAKDWRTYDYYQVPDHVFLSPKGFVDPSIRNGVEGDTYGEDGQFTGVQTAGFPLMQDPFGGLNMNPFKLNRIEHND
jgi:hypothetical protein